MRAQVPADVWLGHPSVAALPPAHLPGPGARVLVVVPHPDDETIGAGETLALLARRGARVSLVLITDGEDAAPQADDDARAALVATRQAELASALAALGLADATVHRLGLPDRRVEEHEDSLAALLCGLLDSSGARGTVLLAPHPQDGHRDHEAAGRAAATAAATCGCPLVTYAVWLWHRREPGEVDLTGAARVDLDQQARLAKAQAVAAYGSQTGGAAPVVAPALVELATAGVEVLWGAAS